MAGFGSNFQAPSTGVGVLKPGAQAGPTVTQGGAGVPQDHTVGNLTQQLLDLANNNGTMTGGSAGTASWTQSLAPQRAASQAAYEVANADRQKVYDQAVAAVDSQKAGVTAGYDAAGASAQAGARARAIADAGQLSTYNSQAAQGAKNLGLDWVPNSANTRSSDTLAANQGKYNQNADSWKGFYDATKQTALRGIDATKNAFTYQGAQQQQVLAALLQKVLAGQQDIFHAGSSGSAGHLTGGTSTAQKIGIYNSMLGQSNKQQAAALAAGKYQSAQKQIGIVNQRASDSAASKNALNAALTKQAGG